jgi:hypothetical protein
MNANARPRSVNCRICGRAYGTASIEIHIPQCEKLFMKRQALLPRHQKQRLPDRPRGLPKFSSSQEQEEYNNIAFRNFNDKVLKKCDNCGRTFHPERLAIHLRSCTVDNPSRRSTASSSQSSNRGHESKRRDGGASSSPRKTKSSSRAAARPSTTTGVGTRPQRPREQESPVQKQQNNRYLPDHAQALMNSVVCFLLQEGYAPEDITKAAELSISKMSP